MAKISSYILEQAFLYAPSTTSRPLIEDKAQIHYCLDYGLYLCREPLSIR